MAGNNEALPVRTGFLGWLNKRLPVDQFMRDLVRERAAQWGRPH